MEIQKSARLADILPKNSSAKNLISLNRIRPRMLFIKNFGLRFYQGRNGKVKCSTERKMENCIGKQLPYPLSRIQMEESLISWPIKKISPKENWMRLNS